MQPYSYFSTKHRIGETAKVGDFVDVLKIDTVFDKVTWSQGKVTEVYSDDLQIAYLYDWEDKVTRVRVESQQIAPF